ncbi:MAG: hypothetical protein CML66_07425 [Rhodobacteraceae bacterium]|nr:hypothetical protein [Paracoccaceae bacterium]
MLDTQFPKVVQAADAVDLGDFIATNGNRISDWLSTHGALLFRGFPVDGPETFENACARFSPGLQRYVGGGALRKNVSGRVYTSTEIAADQVIPLHCESSYFQVPPERIWFYCDTPAATGGQTPVGDMARVLERLPDDLVQRFDSRGVRYFYNMHAGKGFGRGWPDAFGTQDRAEVEAWLDEKGFSHEWRPDGHLYAEMNAPGLRVHAGSGVTVWGNQAASWHVRGLGAGPARAIRGVYKQERLFPKHALFGDGTSIPDADIETILATLAEEEVAFDWQAGDVLLCDNHRIAHGRRPFTGARRVLVTLA